MLRLHTWRHTIGQPISPPPQSSLDAICKLVSVCCYWHKSSTAWPLAFFTLVNTAFFVPLLQLADSVSRLSIGWMVHQICHLIQLTSEERVVRESLLKAHVTLNVFSCGLEHCSQPLFVMNDRNPLLSPCQLLSHV